MTTFDASKHRRDARGRFAAMQGSEPTVVFGSDDDTSSAQRPGGTSDVSLDRFDNADAPPTYVDELGNKLWEVDGKSHRSGGMGPSNIGSTAAGTGMTVSLRRWSRQATKSIGSTIGCTVRTVFRRSRGRTAAANRGPKPRRERPSAMEEPTPQWVIDLLGYDPETAPSAAQA